MANRNQAIEMAAALRTAGFAAYFAGGCVRDGLLGRTVQDYDIATAAPPDRVLQLFSGARLVGQHFGVVLVNDVEVATFRSEGPYSDGRHPDQVRFETDPRQDVLRRDFTINGLLEDPFSGEILDYVGGRDDLRERRIRAIGDPAQRFLEDHLRLLRAVRFAARLGFEIEAETARALRAAAPLIRTVSTERVRDELVRILTEGGARRGFELLDELELLPEILPEVAAMKNVPQPPEFHPEGDVWVHTLLLLEHLPPNPSPTLALGALLHDIAKPITLTITDRIRFHGHAEKGAELATQILERLRFSNDEIRQVQLLVANHMRFIEAPRMKEATLKRFVRLPHFEEHLALHRLDCLSSHRHLQNYEYVKQFRERVPAEQIRPTPLLTGDDLIARGLKPGPEFRRILLALEEEQLESRIETREQALAWLSDFCREHPFENAAGLGR